jgi:hypothetical protein
VTVEAQNGIHPRFGSFSLIYCIIGTADSGPKLCWASATDELRGQSVKFPRIHSSSDIVRETNFMTFRPEDGGDPEVSISVISI